MLATSSRFETLPGINPTGNPEILMGQNPRSIRSFAIRSFCLQTTSLCKSIAHRHVSPLLVSVRFTRKSNNIVPSRATSESCNWKSWRHLQVLEVNVNKAGGSCSITETAKW